MRRRRPASPLVRLAGVREHPRRRRPGRSASARASRGRLSGTDAHAVEAHVHLQQHVEARPASAKGRASVAPLPGCRPRRPGAHARPGQQAPALSAPTTGKAMKRSSKPAAANTSASRAPWRPRGRPPPLPSAGGPPRRSCGSWRAGAGARRGRSPSRPRAPRCAPGASRSTSTHGVSRSAQRCMARF